MATTEPIPTSSTKEVEEYVSRQVNHSGLSAVIHPLALLNITDHFTRVRAQSHSQWDQYKVMGILLGTQTGRKLTISNSFEVKVNITYPTTKETTGDVTTKTELKVTIDDNYLVTKQEHLRQVFPDLDPIGWYSVGSHPTELESTLQLQHIQPRVDSPLYLQFHPQTFFNEEHPFQPTLHNRTDLPLVMYEPCYDVHRTLFIELPDYSVETDSTQRIALAAMVQAKGTQGMGSTQSQSQSELDSPALNQLARHRSSVQVLSSRIITLIDYIEAVMRGELPPDHDILREIACLLHQLPHLKDPNHDPTDDTPTTPNLLYQEYNDTLLTSYLASLTRTTAQLSHLTATLHASREYHRRHGLITKDPLLPSSTVTSSSSSSTINLGGGKGKSRYHH